MKVKDCSNMLDYFENGIYVKSVQNPMIQGLFTEKDAMEESLESLGEDRSLYFIGHCLQDIDYVPLNHFEQIPKGKSIKKTNIEKLRYFILDIDPVNNTELINGQPVKRNLTIEENEAILKEANAVREGLLGEGFESIGLINSGNGAYLVFPFVGLSKIDETIEFLKEFAEILKKKYPLVTAQIDSTTIKATQVFKLPGTLSTKGKATEDNPYRHACIVEPWDAKKSCVKAMRAFKAKYATDNLVKYTSSGPVLDIEACIHHCEKKYPVFRGQNHDYFARVEEKGIIRDLKLDSLDYESELRIHLREATGFVTISPGVIETIITYMKDEAYQKEISPLASRAYFDVEANIVRYDMCNGKDIIEITAQTIQNKPKPVGMFRESITDKEQVQYVDTPATELPKLLRKIANVKDNNLIILATFLCVCFLGNSFPVPIALLTGNFGCSKSTLTRFIQKIVHPQKTSSLSLSTKVQDISIALSNRLLTCFDNASSIKPEIADIFCSAVTKGCYQTRELYTTADEKLVEYNSIIVINGLDVVSRRMDLISRAVYLELEPIQPEQRKTEKEIEKIFNENLPMILGAIFDAIKQALAMGEIELSALSRMADFEEWSVKFAIAMGYSKEEYQSALQGNHQRLVDAVSFGNIVILAVVELMRNKKELKMDFQDFYTKCREVLNEKGIPNVSSMFPGNASALSRALGGMEENLKAFGITFSSRNIGPNKEAQITNDGTVIPNSSSGEIAGKISYETQKENQKSA